MVLPGVVLRRIGEHFPGSAVAHITGESAAVVENILPRECCPKQSLTYQWIVVTHVVTQITFILLDQDRQR